MLHLVSNRVALRANCVVMRRGSGRLLSNSAVNPPHSVVTALAQGSKRRAAGRAGYRERSANTIKDQKVP